jgi:nucleoside-diphosphate-sugar epimerase
MEVNHLGRVRVAKLAKKMGAERYILPSSCSIYGFQEGVLDEESPVNPLTTYAKANLMAEQDVLPLADESFCVVAIRQATVYGVSKRMRFDLAINGMVKGLFQRGTIPILRDGTQWRPFIHVKDTARAMIDLLDVSAKEISGQVINVGSDDQNVQIIQLARVVADAMQIEFRHEWYGSPDNRSYQVSFKKIAEIVGFEPKYTPADGAEEVHEALDQGIVNADDPRAITVEWYKHLIQEGEFL